MGSDMERHDEEEEESVSEILRDRFRLSTISIAEAEGFKIRYTIIHRLLYLHCRSLTQLN